MSESPSYTLRLRFWEAIGTFANVNGLAYFSAWIKNDYPVMILKRNGVVVSKALQPVGEETQIIGPPLIRRNRSFFEPYIRELPLEAEHRFPRTYKAEHFNHRRLELRRAFTRHFFFHDSLFEAARPMTNQLKASRTLGVHLRFTRHYGANPDFSAMMESYYKEIDLRLESESCQQIFVATHMERAFTGPAKGDRGHLHPQDRENTQGDQISG